MSEATIRSADAEERNKLHRLGDRPAIATLATADGEPLEVAVATDQRKALLGPFATVAETS